MINLVEYLSDERNIVFDFTRDNDCESYLLINNPIDRYFAYKSSKKSIIGSCYKEASELAKINVEKYKKVGDPDLSSELLQNIYKLLWPQLCNKEYMLNNNWIQSDTMTSAQNTFNVAIETLIETESEREFRKSYGIRNRVSNSYCIELYIKDREGIIERIMQIPGECSFLNLYHTLGNYVAVPKLFNSARSGRYASHDYWDLTLMKIHEYFLENNIVRIEELLHGKGSTQNCKKWLDDFGSGEFGWKNFIDVLFFQDYVDTDYNVIPFCSGHSWNHPNITDCPEFFINVSRLIFLRGKRMFAECKKKSEDYICNF